MIALIFTITKIIKVPLQQALLICGTCFFIVSWYTAVPAVHRHFP